MFGLWRFESSIYHEQRERVQKVGNLENFNSRTEDEFQKYSNMYRIFVSQVLLLNSDKLLYDRRPGPGVSILTIFVILIDAESLNRRRIIITKLPITQSLKTINVTNITQKVEFFGMIVQSSRFCAKCTSKCIYIETFRVTITVWY